MMSTILLITISYLITSVDASFSNTSVYNRGRNLAFDPLEHISSVKHTDSSEKRRMLYWISNSAGLFSHFFQVKFLFAVSSNWQRDLIIVPYQSVHKVIDKYKGNNTDINLCEVFNFSMTIKQKESISHRIKCSTLNVPRLSFKCATRFRTLQRNDKKSELCYGGKVFGNLGVVPFEKKLQIMNFPPRLDFISKFHKIFLSIVGSGLVFNGTSQTSILPPFAVIHWRRGDQLTTRCADNWNGLRDRSLNCGSVYELMSDIDAFFASITAHRTRPGHVYVATNEETGSILEIFRQNGYILLKDVLKPHLDVLQLSSLDEFILEAQFMLKADIFLSYGISQINDIIEHERMLSGKSWCERDAVAVSERSMIHKHGSWCHLFRNITPIF